jgi:WD40 repeat protein
MRSSTSSASSSTYSRGSASKTWHLNRAFYNYSYSDKVPRISQERIHIQAQLGGHFGRAMGVDFVDNTTIVSCAQDSKMILWNAKSGHKRAWVNLPPGSIPTCCTVERSEHRLMACGGFNASIEVFDIDKCLRAGEHGLLDSIDNLLHNSKEGSGGNGEESPQTNPMQKQDPMHTCTTTSRHEAVFSGHRSFITDITWCEAGKRLISTSGDSSSILWDVEARTKLVTLKGHTDDVNCVAVSPVDSRLFVTAGQDGRCLVWDMRINTSVGKRGNKSSGEKRSTKSTSITKMEPKSAFKASLEKGDAAVNCAAFFPDGHAFLAGGEDGRTSIYDLRCDSMITSIDANEAGSPVNAALFSASGRLVFLGGADGSIRVYDLTRQERAPPMRSSDSLSVLDAHKADVNSLALSPDGSTVASASDDMSIFLWG